MKYSQTLIIDGEYESNHIASQKESQVISILTALHSYTHLSATKYTVHLMIIVTKI